MSEWEIRYEQPHGVGGGPYFVGTFHVGRSGSMLGPVLVKLTFTAAEVFSAEYEKLTHQKMDTLVRDQIIARWGEERITEWLDAHGTLPDDFSIVTRPGGGNSHRITPIDAQEMLKRWGFVRA